MYEQKLSLLLYEFRHLSFDFSLSLTLVNKKTITFNNGNHSPFAKIHRKERKKSCWRLRLQGGCNGQNSEGIHRVTAIPFVTARWTHVLPSIAFSWIRVKNFTSHLKITLFIALKLAPKTFKIVTATFLWGWVLTILPVSAQVLLVTWSEIIVRMFTSSITLVKYFLVFTSPVVD